LIPESTNRVVMAYMSVVIPVVVGLGSVVVLVGVFWVWTGFTHPDVLDLTVQNRNPSSLQTTVFRGDDTAAVVRVISVASASEARATFSRVPDGGLSLAVHGADGKVRTQYLGYPTDGDTMVVLVVAQSDSLRVIERIKPARY